MPLRIDRLVAVLAIATLFLPAFRIRTESIDLYFYYALLPVILVLCVAAGSNLTSRRLVLFLGALATHSVLSVILLGNPPRAAAQQLIGITVVSVVLYNTAYVNRFDPIYLFSVYMRFSKVVALIALLQFAFYLAGLKPGYDFSWTGLDFHQSYTLAGLPRIQSIFGEPSHFALAMSPAIYVSVVTLLGMSRHFAGRLWSVLVLAAATLSFSTMAYLAIVFALCLAGFTHGLWRKTMVVSAAGLFAIAAYAFVPEFRLRVDDTFLAFLYQDPLQKNISTLTLYNNWQVAFGNLSESYMLGGGLGSHPIVFERHSTLASLGSIPYWLASLNAQDANSLLLRVVSELGLPGIAALFGFLICHYVARPRERTASTRAAETTENAAWVVSNAALTFIAMALVRHGHYFAMGTPFFLLLYYYAYRYARLAEPAPRPTDVDHLDGAEAGEAA